MIIAAAQIKPVTGNIDKNILNHCHIIRSAVDQNINIIFFPELSITHYEPLLAKKLKVDLSDARFNVFQELSNQYDIMISIGAPIVINDNMHISNLFFMPLQERLIYTKTKLHDDETPFFKPLTSSRIIEFNSKKIAPAICYESMLPEHLNSALQHKAEIYLTSVAKDEEGIIKGNAYYPVAAKKSNIPIIMSNSVGKCDNFIAAGQSAIWNRDGQLKCQMRRNDEGIAIYNSIEDSAKIILE